jgi:hypothetical protein
MKAVRSFETSDTVEPDFSITTQKNRIVKINTLETSHLTGDSTVTQIERARHLTVSFSDLERCSAVFFLLNSYGIGRLGCCIAKLNSGHNFFRSLV